MIDFGQSVREEDLKNPVEFQVAGDQIVHVSRAGILQVTSPPMICAFPRLTRDQLNTDRNRGIKTNSYGVDITMKGAVEAQNTFRAFMDDLDEKLLDFVVNNPQVLKSNMRNLTREGAAVMIKPCFRARSSYKTGRMYDDAMSCRSNLNVEHHEGVPVIDVNNNPYTEPLEYNSIIRVVLTYHGPYVITGSMFGNGWKLGAVQYLGKAEDAPPPPPPSFNATDMSMFPVLGR